MSEPRHAEAHLQEDIASEQAFFDRYFQEADARAAADGYMVKGDWVARAIAPRDRSLEYWEHEEGLQEKELEAFHWLFAQAHVRRFNFLAKTNRLCRRFGPLAEGFRWVDYILLSAVPALRRYCTCIVARFGK